MRTTDNPEPETAGVLAPPPVLFLAALTAGLVLDAVKHWPLPVSRAIEYIVGALLVVAGLTLSFIVTRYFQRSRTPISALQPTRHLVVAGPYRFSRNPDYIGQTLVYCGLCLLFGSFWLVCALAPTLLLIRYFVIAREERYLERIFGDEYQRYCQRVRRWL